MSKLETNTIDNISGSSTLNLGDTNATAITIDSGVSTLTIPNGITTGHMYPAFEAYLSSTQSLGDNSSTKVQFDTEVFDEGGYYDNSTNYRYTPLVAGKYFVYAKARLQTGANSTLAQSEVQIRKNGSSLIETRNIQSNNYTRADTPIVSGVVDMNGTTDYLEVYALADQTSGTNDGIIGSSTKRHSNFGAYRIGA